MRIPFLRRERAAVVYLRSHFGYTIQALSKAFGRSTSSVHAILKFNEAINAIRHFDERKLPTMIKRLQAARHDRTLMQFIDAWNAWIISEEGEPP